jgi:hypothetical protein
MTEDRRDNIADDDGPAMRQQDWDATEGTEIEHDRSKAKKDSRYSEAIRADHSPDEEDDNACRESDKALPDDKEEAAIRRDPTGRKIPRSTRSDSVFTYTLSRSCSSGRSEIAARAIVQA